MATGSLFMQKLASREGKLVALLAVIGIFAGAAVGYIYLGNRIQEVEEGLEEGEEALAEIRLLAEDYLDSMRRKKGLEEAIKGNDARIQTAIDSVARKVDATRLKGIEGEETTFNTVLKYEAKTTERAIMLGEKKKKRDKSDFVELSQPAEYSFVKFVDLVRFMEQLESPERLMYVSKLQVTRKYMEPEYVQGKMTIATFIHRPQTEEEEED